MEFLTQFIDFFLHLDKHLFNIVEEYGTLTYVILFLIVFTETGLVIMPLLPGDSLLFAAGAIAANEGTGLNVWLIIIVLIIAALMGDNVNYFMGKNLGGQIKKSENDILPEKRVSGKNRSILRKTRRQHGNYGPFYSDRPYSSTICCRRRKHELFEIHCFLYRRRIALGTITYIARLFLRKHGYREEKFRTRYLRYYRNFSILPMIFSILKSRFAKPSAA
jgi:membrane-associated protein